MLIKLKRPLYINGTTQSTDKPIEVDERYGAVLIKKGYAEESKVKEEKEGKKK